MGGVLQVVQKGFLRPSKTTLTMKSLERFEQTGGIKSIASGSRNRGFSLVEILAVIAVLGILLSLMGPVVEGLAGSGGRKGGVTIVMNTLEQARVAAIQRGREVVVVFWKKNGTSDRGEQDAMMVLQRNEDDTDWEPISRWVKLPKGVLFYSDDEASRILDGSALDMIEGIEVADLPGAPESDHVGALHFTRSGAVQSPNSSNGLRVAITEGQRAADGALAVDRRAEGGYEVISVAKFTGRASLDISSL